MLIRRYDLGITIMHERYGDGLLFGLDMPVYFSAFSTQPLHDLIDQATSPGDVDAIEASCGLADLAEEYPELLYVQEDTLEEGLKKLNERAEKWVYLTQEEQDHILKIGQEVMVVTDSKSTFHGKLSFFSDKNFKIRQNERIEVCIPFEAITHIVDYGNKGRLLRIIGRWKGVFLRYGKL